MVIFFDSNNIATECHYHCNSIAVVGDMNKFMVLVFDTNIIASVCREPVYHVQ
jgi:hypothetical protein